MISNAFLAIIFVICLYLESFFNGDIHIYGYQQFNIKLQTILYKFAFCKIQPFRREKCCCAYKNTGN